MVYRLIVGNINQDIRDGALWIIQNKAGAPLGIEIAGELATVITKINERPRRAISAYLIQDENRQPLTSGALTKVLDSQEPGYGGALRQSTYGRTASKRLASAHLS